MKIRYITFFLLLFALLMECSEEVDRFPDLSMRIPYFMERLYSNRWQVRYCLLYDLPGRNAETKRALEILINDENIRVAEQAHRGYLGFIEIDKTLFRPELYFRSIMSDRFLVGGIPKEDQFDAFVDNCVLGLCSAKLDDRTLSENLAIVGIMGKPSDVEAVYPYLQSPDDGIAYSAAVAVIRLGDREKGIETLRRLAGWDPSKEPRYMFHALYALKEIQGREPGLQDPELEKIVLNAVASIDSSRGIRPDKLYSFLLPAADFTSKNIWNEGEPLNKAEESGQFPDLAKSIPCLVERLRSNRWQVRYGLLHDLTGRDVETKRALETLMRDENKSVANQATVRYLYGFVDIDKSLFKPAIFFYGKPDDEFSALGLLSEGRQDALVEKCLGRLKSAKLDDPGIYGTLTVVGILGNRSEAKALYPFLESSNEFVASIAAQAVVRIGDREKGIEAFKRLAMDPSKKHFSSTGALYALQELQDPELEGIVNKILASIDQRAGLYPEWINTFLLFAAEVTGEDVWNATESQIDPYGGGDKENTVSGEDR